jgi:hypothetical protein
MRIHRLLITGALFGVAVAAHPASARAQDSTVHKAAAAVHHTLKKAGVKSSKAAVHHSVQKMGDSTKAAVKKPQ